jgi:hypothetical protein
MNICLANASLPKKPISIRWASQIQTTDLWFGFDSLLSQARPQHMLNPHRDCCFMSKCAL